ncbi:MAG: Crp/Fnr family transcriptional regulator [Clostridiales bacterium]|nr:Crp/Fnr family transcriptional regulator [Clostridiales bacterium]
MKEYLQITQKNALFNNIDDQDILHLLNCLSARVEVFEKNSYIIMEDGKVSDIGIVLDGRAHVIRDDFWGNRSILAELKQGEMFGEAFAFAGQETAPVSVISVEKCKILFLSVQNMLSTCLAPCSRHIALINNLIKILAQKNVLLTQKIQFVTQKKTRDKLLAYLSSQEKLAHSNTFTIPFNRQELADYLSVDRSAMSNELSKMRDEGILDFNKNLFTLK